MLKLLGAVMIIGATSAVGFSKLEALGGRIKALNAFITAFETLLSETSFRLTPLPELFAMLAEAAPPPAREFFAECLRLGGDLSETGLVSVWNRAVRGVRYLEQDDRNVLIAAGAAMGRYDPEGQRGSLQSAIGGLKKCLGEAEEKRRAEGKVWATLGVASGLAVVIILI